MKKFTETEYRQMIDTLKVKSQSDEFDSTFYKALKSVLTWDDAKDALDTMRKAYVFS